MDHITLKLDREGINGGEKSKRGERGGDYSREAIISNISVKWGQLFEGGD